jgi:indole-3-acetate monooxygenase
VAIVAGRAVNGHPSLACWQGAGKLSMDRESLWRAGIPPPGLGRAGWTADGALGTIACVTVDGLGRDAGSIADSAAVRDSLVAAIRERRPEFGAAGERAEALRTLPADTVATLRSLGLFWLKTPAELGGTPLAPLDFCDVMEEAGYADTATAWTVMVGNGGTGTAGGWLPDAGARAVFPPGAPLPLVMGTPGPRGTGRPVAGGYLVSGRWPFASGCAHADWLIGGFRELSGSEELSGGVQEYGPGRVPGRLMVAIVPRSSATITDNWQVAGLQGSGSFDFALSEVFVPAEFTFERAASACRGGALFHQEAHVFLSNEVPPLCVGMARRAVDLMASLALGTARFPGGPLVSDRAVFLKELGRAQTRVRAARAVHREAIASALAAAGASGDTPPDVHLAVAAASTYAVETCTEVIFDLFRYGGGRVLSLSSPVQRYLRDAIAARQHIGVSEENYERAGAYRVSSAAR